MPRRSLRPDAETLLAADSPADLDVLEERGAPALVEPVLQEEVTAEAGQAGLQSGDRLQSLEATPVAADVVLAIVERTDEEDVVVEDVGARRLLHLELDSADPRVIGIRIESLLQLLDAVSGQDHVVVQEDDDVASSKVDAGVPRGRDALDAAVVYVRAPLRELRAHHEGSHSSGFVMLALVDDDQLVGE